MDERSQGEITAVEDVSVPGISHAEITAVEDFSVPETSKVVDPRWTDWIHTLCRLNKLSEALLPAEFNPLKANKDGKSSVSVGGSDDHHMPGSDVTVAHCSCQIDSDVEMQWKNSIMWDDCIKLMELLKNHPCLLAIHGSGGDTALHVATRQGNLKLLVYICSLFLDDLGNAVTEYVHGDNKIDRHDLFKKENDDQLTAKDCLWFTFGGTTMYVYFLTFLRFGVFGPSENGNATLAAMQEEVFNPFYDNHPVSMRLDDCTGEDKRGVDAKLRMKEIIIKEYNESRLKQLDEDSPRDSDFIAEYEELRFLHNTALRLEWEGVEEYLRAVIRGCVEAGPDVVKYLFRHRNASGQTAFHCADERTCAMLSEEIPGEKYKECCNARDVRGWTALHCAIAKGDEVKVECLLKDTRVDVNAQMTGDIFRVWRWTMNGVALHLAIMHDRVNVVRMLLQRKDTNVNAMYSNSMKNIGCDIPYTQSDLKNWTPLQLAVLLGRHQIIKALLNHPEVYDQGLQNHKSLLPIGVQDCEDLDDVELPCVLSAIHIAGMMSDPQTLRCFLNISKFDLSVTIRGCTALHFVVDGTPLILREELLKNVNFYDLLQYEKYSMARKDKQNGPSDEDREACIAILIQAGLDVWQKNHENKFPEPGLHTSPHVRHFWQQKLLSETQDAKNNLNDMANAISVVSALVATASYVGPLQPPLGLDSNSVQGGSLPIRIYMITNTLSFYVAVASIIFAVVPSLPMPQEGLYEEWQRCQKTIIVAIHLLLLAVLNILISFGAASNAVMSSEYSWQHKGLVFYPTLLGGLLCLIAICLFYLRLFRLAFVKNLTIKRIYHSVYRTTQ